MVVILAAVTSKSGKALFARQFTEMTRVRVEGLLSAFPKLMDASSQHTYVETESVRYVYQPMEKLYLLLVTNKSSNIIEDLDTLNLLSLIIKDKLETISDEEVLDNAYELMFGFDEVINLGYREYLGLDQVNTILEMDSHEEALQKLIYESKLDDARKAGKDAETRISKIKKDGGAPSGRMKGISSSDLGMSNNLAPDSFSSQSSNDFSSNVGSYKSDSYSSSYSEKKEAPKKAFKLGSSKKKVSLLENLVQQGEVQREEEEEIDSKVIEQKPKNTIPTEKVHLKIEEEVDVELNRQGTVTDVEVKGHMFLVITEKDAGFIRVHLSEEMNSNFTPKTHPNLDKKLYSKDNSLGLKNTSKSFPTGNPLKVLQWTSNAKETSLVPLTVTCWPSSNGSKGMSCTLEYELKNEALELNDVKIIIPVPVSDVKVEDVEQGTYTVKNNILTWQLDHITSDSSSGTLEFDVPAGDENSFFPISVQFTSLQTISDIKFDKVNSTVDDEEVTFSTEYSLTGICNGTTCNTQGGKCDNNGKCECLNSPKEGYWTGVGCFECKQNYDKKDNCKSCLAGFDINNQCKTCLDGKYGPNCNQTCACNPKGGKCDGTNGVCTCFNSATEGFWSGDGCYDCQQNYEKTSQCKTCISGFDIEKGCKACIKGRYGPTCQLLCDPQEKCHGNGFCLFSSCVCYNDNDKGHWDQETDCSTCQTGYNSTSKCVQPICIKNKDGVECSGKGSCIAPNTCNCPFNAGDNCEFESCYGAQGNSPMVCSGNGRCTGYDTCECSLGFRGRQCDLQIKSDIFFGGVVVLVTVSGISVFAIMIFIAILYRRKVVSSAGDDIKWSELEDDADEEDFMMDSRE